MDDRLHGGRIPSLRWRLLRLVTVATLLAWALAAAFIYHQARHDVQELMDAQLTETAKVLLALAPDSPASPSRTMAEVRAPVDDHGEMPLEFQVLRPDGVALLRSANGPRLPSNAEPGYRDLEFEATPWRSLVLVTADGTLRAQVAHPITYRDKEALEIAWNAILPLALLLPVLVLLIYFSIRHGLRPLDDLASDVATRSPENLGHLATGAVPLEARPLVRALNQLLGRLTTTLENERRFTADAAHELRTPLAALKVQAQIAMATRDPEQHRHALSQVLAGTDRATRLVEQLLRLARLDPIVRLADTHPVDLAELARAVLAQAPSLPSGRDEAPRLLTPEAPVVIDGDPDLLGIALRNLIDNALRYTPAGAGITVSAGREHGEPYLAVTDTGPGVPPEDLPRIVERFYRGRDAGAEGSGLGLAIVRRIAELHGARLEVDNLPGGGLIARLRWCGVPPGG